MVVYRSIMLLLIFFYDSLPIASRVYTLKRRLDYKFCPLYFGVRNATDNESIIWYTLNDSYNGHWIQCIGRSPYILSNGSFIENCLPDYSYDLCKDIKI